MGVSRHNFLINPQWIHFCKRKTLKNPSILKVSTLNNDALLGHYKLSIFNGISDKLCPRNSYHHSIQSRDMHTYHLNQFFFLFARENYRMSNNDLLDHMSYSHNCMADINLLRNQENVFLRIRICQTKGQRLLIFRCRNAHIVWLQIVMLSYSSSGIPPHTTYFHKWWDYWGTTGMRKQLLNRMQQNLFVSWNT